MSEELKNGRYMEEFGTVRWYLNGLLHREDEPAVEYLNGYKEWYQNGQLHREGGPAIVNLNGAESWWRHGVLHRDDGPAVEYPSGRMEWWLDGVELTEEEHAKHILNKKLTEQLEVKPTHKRVKI